VTLKCKARTPFWGPGLRLLQPELKCRFMALDSPLMRLELVADTLGQIGFKTPS
jgi:hypothetical protein